MRIKKGDKVIVLSGKDKGKTGPVLTSFPSLDKVVVEGLNLRSRRVKPRRSSEKGQVVQKAQPFHISSVAIFCATCKKGVRLKMKGEGEKKARICATCGKTI